MSAPAYAVTVEKAPAQPEPEDIKRAALEMDLALRRLFGSPHSMEDIGVAYAWSRMRAALWPAGSRSGGGR